MQPLDFVSFLPEVVWYLTSNGSDMWCRRPYGFFFTTREQAEAFALEMKTAFDLVPIGVARKDLLSDDTLAGLRRLEVTRIFVDPRVDGATGEVFGRILRLEALN